MSIAITAFICGSGRSVSDYCRASWCRVERRRSFASADGPNQLKMAACCTGAEAGQKCQAAAPIATATAMAIKPAIRPRFIMPHRISAASGCYTCSPEGATPGGDQCGKTARRNVAIIGEHERSQLDGTAASRCIPTWRQGHARTVGAQQRDFRGQDHLGRCGARLRLHRQSVRAITSPVGAVRAAVLAERRVK